MPRLHPGSAASFLLLPHGNYLTILSKTRSLRYYTKSLYSNIYRGAIHRLSPEVTKIVTPGDKNCHLTGGGTTANQPAWSPLTHRECRVMRNTKFDVLITITSIIRKYKGNWCYASRDRILELLLYHHSISIGYRQLGNHLADLRDQGLIKSIRRNHRKEDGTLCLLTSARCLTIKACNYLIKRGLFWLKQHRNYLKRKYLPPPDPGKPREIPPLPPQPDLTTTPENRFTDPEIRKKLGLKPIPPWIPVKS